MAKIHIENGIISSSADYGLYHGTSEIAKVEAGGLRVQGDVTAENLIVSSSVTFMTQSFSSGSTIFGDTGDDTHQFTGSLKIQSGSIDITSTQSPNYGMRFVTSAGHQYFKIRNGNSETFPYGQLVLNYSNNSSYYSFINMVGSYNLRIAAGTSTSLGALYINAHTSEIANFHGTNGLTVKLGNISGSASSTGSFGQGHVANLLGVGTLSPSSKLHVVGGIRTQSDNNNISFYLANNTTRLMEFKNMGDNSTILKTSGAYNLRFGTADVDRLMITAGGNVGIGTTSPGAKLTVHGDISGSAVSTGSFGTLQSTTATIPTLLGNTTVDATPNANFTIKDTGSNPIRLQLNNASSTSNFQALEFLDSSGTEGYIRYTHGTDEMTFAGKGTAGVMLTLDSSGNAIFAGNKVSGSSTSTGSFGQAFIDSQLEIGKVLGSTTTPSIIINDNPSYRGEIGYSQASNTTFFFDNTYNNDNAQTQFRTGGSAKMIIRGNGGVGIGTSPAMSYAVGLHIKNASNVVNLKLHSGGGYGFDLWQDTGGTAYLINHDNAKIQFVTNHNASSTIGMEIKANGNIEFPSASTISGSSTSTGSFGKLHVGPATEGGGVNSPIGLSVNTHEQSLLRISRKGAESNYLDISGGSQGGVYNSNTSGTQAHIFKIANTEKVRIDAGGHITGSGAQLGDFSSTKLKLGTSVLHLSEDNVTNRNNLALGIQGVGMLGMVMHEDTSFRAAIYFDHATDDAIRFDLAGGARFLMPRLENVFSGSAASTGSFGTIQTTTGTIPTLFGNTEINGVGITASSNARIISKDNSSADFTIRNTGQNRHIYFNVNNGGSQDNAVQIDGLTKRLFTFHTLSSMSGQQLYLSADTTAINFRINHVTKMTMDASGNLSTDGNISGSASSTGSFGTLRSTQRLTLDVPTGSPAAGGSTTRGLIDINHTQTGGDAHILTYNNLNSDFYIMSDQGRMKFYSSPAPAYDGTGQAGFMIMANMDDDGTYMAVGNGNLSNVPLQVKPNMISGSGQTTGSFGRVEAGEGHFTGQHVGIGIKNTSNNTLYVNSVGNGQSARFATDNVLNYIHITNSGGANHYIETNQHSIALSADANNTRGTVQLKTSNTTALNVDSSQNITLKQNKNFGSETYSTGFGGQGYQIGLDSNNLYQGEFDNLFVRGRMTIYELLINQIRASNGAIYVSDAAKVDSVTKVNSTTFRLKFDTGEGYGHPFQQHDLLKAQRFNGSGTYVSRLQVTAVNGTTGLTASLQGGDTPPSGGFEFVRVGNTSDADRQGAIYLTNSDSGAPFIDIYDGVISHIHPTGSQYLKVRTGRLDGITSPQLGSLSGYGFYASGSAFLEGKINATAGGIIAGWDLNANTIEKVDGNGGVRLDSSNKRIDFLSNASTTRLRVGQVDSNKFGIRGFNASGNRVFEISEVRNEIAGWSIQETVISSSAGNMQIDSGNSRFLVKDPNGQERVRMGKLNGSNQYGISGSDASGNLLFKLGEAGNEIAGWGITQTVISSSSGNVQVDSGNTRFLIQDNSGQQRVRMGLLTSVGGEKYGISGSDASGNLLFKLGEAGNEIAGWGITETVISSSDGNVQIDAGNSRFLIKSGSGERVRMGLLNGNNQYGISGSDSSGNLLFKLGDAGNEIAGWRITQGKLDFDHPTGSIAIDASNKNIAIYTGSINTARPKVVMGKLPTSGNHTTQRYGFAVFSGSANADITNDDTYSVLITRDKARLAGWDLVPGRLKSGTVADINGNQASIALGGGSSGRNALTADATPTDGLFFVSASSNPVFYVGSTFSYVDNELKAAGWTLNTTSLTSPGGNVKLAAISSTSNYLGIGTTAFSGSGIFIGQTGSGKYQLSAVGTAGKMLWDNEKLEVQGADGTSVFKTTSTGATIGGFTISHRSIVSDSSHVFIDEPTKTISVGSGTIGFAKDNRIHLTNESGNTKFSVGKDFQFENSALTISGSAVTLNTPTFLLGDSTNFISGSNGNMKINSGDFELDATDIQISSTQASMSLGGKVRIQGGTDSYIAGGRFVTHYASDPFSAFASNETGFILGMDNTVSKFEVGAGSSNYIRFQSTGTPTLNIKAETFEFGSTDFKFTNSLLKLGELDGVTDYESSETGFYVNSSGNVLIKAGGANSNYIQFNDGDLKIITNNFTVNGGSVSMTGTVTANAGQIGGWGLSSNAISASNVFLTSSINQAGLVITDGTDTILSVVSSSGLTEVNSLTGSKGSSPDAQFEDNQFELGSNTNPIANANRWTQGTIIWDTDLSAGHASQPNWEKDTTNAIFNPQCAELPSGTTITAASFGTKGYADFFRDIPVSDGLVSISAYLRAFDWKYYGDKSGIEAYCEMQITGSDNATFANGTKTPLKTQRVQYTAKEPTFVFNEFKNKGTYASIRLKFVAYHNLGKTQAKSYTLGGWTVDGLKIVGINGNVGTGGSKARVKPLVELNQQGMLLYSSKDSFIKLDDGGLEMKGNIEATNIDAQGSVSVTGSLSSNSELNIKGAVNFSEDIALSIGHANPEAKVHVSESFFTGHGNNQALPDNMVQGQNPSWRKSAAKSYGGPVPDGYSSSGRNTYNIGGVVKATFYPFLSHNPDTSQEGMTAAFVTDPILDSYGRVKNHALYTEMITGTPQGFVGSSSFAHRMSGSVGIAQNYSFSGNKNMKGVQVIFAYPPQATDSVSNVAGNCRQAGYEVIPFYQTTMSNVPAGVSTNWSNYGFHYSRTGRFDADLDNVTNMASNGGLAGIKLANNSSGQYSSAGYGLYVKDFRNYISDKLGINNTLPSYALDVTGEGRFTSTLYTSNIQGDGSVTITGFNSITTNNLVTTGNVDLGNATSDTITFTGRVDSHLLPSTSATYDLGGTSNRWNNIYTTDLQLSNIDKDKGNDVDGTRGDWTLQEGDENLYVINNISGKKYKIALIPMDDKDE